MASPLILSLVMIATILNGFLAGGNIDRMVVQMPAWRRIGLRAWAEYSRKADLGNGLFLYPFEAIGGAIFSIAAAILVYFHMAETPTGMLPAGLGGIFAIGGLLLTLKAAPIMLVSEK
jgi:hypothetical protein